MKRIICSILSVLCFFLGCTATADSLDGQVDIAFTPDGPVWNGGEISWDDHVLSILGSGTYVLSGSLEDGRIVIESGRKGKVLLLLNDLSLTSRNGIPLEIASADEVTIVSLEGTVNHISSLSEGEDAVSAVFSRGDLILSGNGTLAVESAGKHGIQSTDGILVSEGTVTIQAAKSGVRAHDFFHMDSGELHIISAGDGIRTTGDEEVPGRGVIEICGGRIEIQTESDGIQSAESIQIQDGDLQITSGGGHESAPAHQETWGRRRYEEEDNSSETDSQKGLKCETLLVISGGEITIDAADDAVHSNDLVEITGGTLHLKSGDDGIHADSSLTLAGGKLEILQAYEGMEASQIWIAGGDISIFTDDDGINAYGGTNAWGWHPHDAEPVSDEDMPSLSIEGGNIYIRAEGDGLDSNGNLSIHGGTVVVDGPSRSMNGALDSGKENGGSLTITGGTILAIGTSGMAETFEDSSTQCSFRYNGLSFTPGDRINIESADGTLLFEHEAAKSGNSIVFSCPELSVGQQLRLTVGNESELLELTDSTSSFGESSRWGWW